MMPNEAIGPMEAIKAFFGTVERPVTKEEIRALGAKVILELAPACAEALGMPYRPPQSNRPS